MKDLLDLETELEIKALRRELEKLKDENDRFRKVIEEHDLVEEAKITKVISPEEKICLDGIMHLTEVFKNGTFDKSDVTNFDFLHKNIRLIRGQSNDTKKKKKFDVNEALKIVDGYKDK